MEIARFRRVIVGFDDSPAARVAAAWAAAEAERHDARLVVWTVLDGNAVRAGAPPRLDAPYEWRSVHGRPASTLVEACGSGDLLVLGARGRASMPDFYRGSVVRACLHIAPCPVAVVPEAITRHRLRHRVIVGVDGSPASRAALAVAADEAALREAALHAVHAVHWDPLGVEMVRPSDRDLVCWGRHLVKGELSGAGVKAHPVVVPGHVADVLVHHSEHADLLVLGSRGHRPLAGLLLGSTAEHCAYHAHCPTMLVRAP
jgi:nucleotide-binding universal stress UspA family protein